MSKEYVPRIRKNYVKENPKELYMAPWAKPLTDAALHGNYPYMVYHYDPKTHSEFNYFHVLPYGDIADDRYYYFLHGAIHTYIEDGEEYISKSTLYLKDSIQIWAFCPNEFNQYAEFRISHDGPKGKWIHYLYSFQKDQVSNYNTYIDRGEHTVWRDLNRDDIEFITSVLDTEIPNCYIGNLLIKQCRDLWEMKYPRERVEYEY